MGKPVILSVDDDPQVRNAIERDLRARYRPDYRIIKTESGMEALEVVQRLKQRSDPIALFVVDQRMPEMEGTEFLARAMVHYPEAKKVLLTAYADSKAAIQAINEIGLDYYLMKPWDPPELHLYPVLDELLEDWQHSVELPYEGIRVAGTLWSSGCHTIKDFLSRSQIPYKWLDIEKDPEAGALVDSVSGGRQNVPVVFFPDGTALVNPDLKTLAAKAGLQTAAKGPFYDLVVVGAGPAGLAAAVYGSSEGLRTILVEKETTGGQAGMSSRIENYLGFPNGISGGDLARRATVQAARLGAEILAAQEACSLRIENGFPVITLADGNDLACHAVILATGVSIRVLEVPGIEAMTGAGVYYGAALSEAAHYAGKHVFVVGGANSAGQGAMFLARHAKKVTMLVRSSLSKSMSQYLIDQIANTPKIEVLPGTRVVEVHGERQLEAVSYRIDDTGEVIRADTPALFVFIGARPHSDLVRGVTDLSEDGFILTGPDLSRNGTRYKNWPLKRDPYLLETSVPGVFAAGDVRFGVVRRVASAVGQGSTAVSFVHEYLKTV